ncbi:MAG TPA: NUDIX hydrolase [Sporichthyaceae bacterium]|jgi:8-oxo-dGTP pyrophosphatase MutT (NUDIX family)
MSIVPGSLVGFITSRRLPEGFAEKVRQLESGELTPVPPRDAATVMLLRERDDATQVYTLRRQKTMNFGAGMYVFPGGSVDPRDASAEIRWFGPPPAQWAAAFGVSEDLARALVCAAVRETFEESGVLLAGPDEHSVVADTSGEDWEADRRALLDRTLHMSDFLDQRGLCVRADLLRPWAHWITPEVEPTRFDTRFFVAAMPTGQRTREFGEEADRVEWIAPGAAVERWKAGALKVMPPTLITIAELAEYKTVADTLAGAADRVIRPILPKVELRGEEAHVLLDAEDPGAT